MDKNVLLLEQGIRPNSDYIEIQWAGRVRVLGLSAVRLKSHLLTNFDAMAYEFESLELERQCLEHMTSKFACGWRCNESSMKGRAS
jgi:hypothetical protein